MGWTLDDINADAIRKAVREMPSQFQTKDVSERRDVLIAHGFIPNAMATTYPGQYHSIVGRYLSKYRKDLKLALLDTPSDGKGAHWSKSLPR